MSQAFDLRTVVPRFVAEISGLRLDRPVSAPVIDDITAAWTEHAVVVFPEQPLDHDGLAAFARRFGEFGVDPYVKPLAGNAHVIEVRREAHESAPIFGASWHSDWSFQAKPPSGTLLHAKTLPPIGGDTLFADCFRAYESLTEELKGKLANLSAIHSAAPSYGPKGLFAQDDPSRSMQIIVSSEAENTETHPIVRTHPVSGRQGLFINHVYTLAIADMEPTASRSLLKVLFDHMTRDEFVYRHRWQPDMLVLWDNRAVVHYADGGYDGYQRVMHRTTLAGERPT